MVQEILFLLPHKFCIIIEDVLTKICPSDPKISIKCWMVSPVEQLFQPLVMNQHFLSSHWGKRDLFYVDDFNLKFDCIFSSLSKMCYYMPGTQTQILLQPFC